jgi:hypothetical protein
MGSLWDWIALAGTTITSINGGEYNGNIGVHPGNLLSSPAVDFPSPLFVCFACSISLHLIPLPCVSFSRHRHHWVWSCHCGGSL